MGDIAMTKTQRDLARHALGLPNKRKVSYRNYFVTGEGSSDYDHWVAMVAMGASRQRKGNDLSGGDDVFRLTRAGAEYALNDGEKLSSEDFPKIGGTHD